MRSRQLEAALTVLVEEAAVSLQRLVAAGAEVPLELVAQTSRRGQTPLYSYRPQTRLFIREHADELRRLAGYPEAVRLLEAYEGLERYLLSRDLARTPARADGQARVAIGLLLEDVFAEQTDFNLRPERLQAALERIEGAQEADPDQVTLAATLHGLAISSPEICLAPGLRLARPEAIEGLPPDLLDAAEGESGDGLLVLYTVQSPDGPAALRAGRQIMGELLEALRLYGDGRLALGGLAWGRLGSGQWRPIALGRGGRPHGRLLVSADREDELRAFCSLVTRRLPREEPTAWALERFHMGCERERPLQALSDYLLALRVLLACPAEGEPELAGDRLLAKRLAALCAPPEEHAATSERIMRAALLERAAIAGEAPEDQRARMLVEEVEGHLRALLRDIICGHLEPDLAVIAEEILDAPPPPPPPVASGDAPSDFPPASGSGEQQLGETGQDSEVVDVPVEQREQDRVGFQEGLPQERDGVAIPSGEDIEIRKVSRQASRQPLAEALAEERLHVSR